MACNWTFRHFDEIPGFPVMARDSPFRRNKTLDTFFFGGSMYMLEEGYTLRRCDRRGFREAQEFLRICWYVVVVYKIMKQHSRPFWLAHTSVLLQILAFWSLWQVDVDLGKLRLRPRIQRAVHWDDTPFQQTLQAIQRWRQACHRLSLLDRVGFFKWVSWCCFGVVWCWGCSDHSGSRSFASFWIPRQFFVAVVFFVWVILLCKFQGPMGV